MVRNAGNKLRAVTHGDLEDSIEAALCEFLYQDNIFCFLIDALGYKTLQLLYIKVQVALRLSKSFIVTGTTIPLAVINGITGNYTHPSSRSMVEQSS